DGRLGGGLRFVGSLRPGLHEAVRPHALRRGQGLRVGGGRTRIRPPGGVLADRRLCRRREEEPDDTFLAFLPVIERHAGDGRNFVKKAVNWALRQIGKRSMSLHGPALALAERLAASSDRAARWIGRDAVK